MKDSEDKDGVAWTRERERDDYEGDEIEMTMMKMDKGEGVGLLGFWVLERREQMGGKESHVRHVRGTKNG